MLSPNIVTFIAHEIIPAGSRVKFVSGSAMRVQLADAAEIEIGTAILHSGKSSYAADSAVGVKLTNDGGSRTCLALDAIAAGALVYRAIDGKVAAGGAGDAFGVAAEASLADLDYLEVFYLPGLQAQLGGANTVSLATATFNPSLTAGERTIAAHTLGVTIPALAIVVGGFIQVNTTFTSATDAATIALSVEAANDIRSAVAISTGVSWDAGSQPIIPKFNTPETTGVKATVARLVTATVAVEALTAGKATIFLFYVQGL